MAAGDGGEGVPPGPWGTSGPGGWAWARADNAPPAQPGRPAAGTQRKSPGFSVMLYCEALAKGQPPDTKNDGGHLNR